MLVNLQNQKYDLNTLFSFETLKEVLFKLAMSQDKLEKEMKNMKESNKQRDITISNIKNILQENLGFSINGSENIPQNENNEQDLNKNNEITNQNKNENENNNIEKIKEISNKNENIESNINENSQSQRKQSYNAPPELISQMSKQIKENKMKIAALEDKLKKESTNIQTNETNFKNHENQNNSDIKLLTDKIEEILQKNIDYDKKIENLEVKTSDFDIFSMFKDNGDGTIDATKVMVKSLEEKIKKKFE